MNINKTLKYILAFRGVLGTLATIIGVYLQYSSSGKHKLEIKSVPLDPQKSYMLEIDPVLFTTPLD